MGNSFSTVEEFNTPNFKELKYFVRSCRTRAIIVLRQMATCHPARCLHLYISFEDELDQRLEKITNCYYKGQSEKDVIKLDKLNSELLMIKRKFQQGDYPCCKQNLLKRKIAKKH